MSENATDQDLGTSADTEPDVNPDLWRVPNEEGVGDPAKAYATDAAKLKERAILYGRSHAEFTLPTGKVLRIFSKSEGALERVDAAFREWFDLKVTDEGEKRRKWRHWGLRRRRLERTLTAVHAAKFRLFALIFEDLYDPEKHQELTAEDFLSMPQALQADIWTTYREAQNAGDLIAAMFPDVDDAKKKAIRQALAPTGTSI